MQMGELLLDCVAEQLVYQRTPAFRILGRLVLARG